MLSAFGPPPWVVFSLLVGVGSAGLFHLHLEQPSRAFTDVSGRWRDRRPARRLLGAARPHPWSLGESHLLAICGATWSALALTRLLGL